VYDLEKSGWVYVTVLHVVIACVSAFVVVTCLVGEDSLGVLAHVVPVVVGIKEASCNQIVYFVHSHDVCIEAMDAVIESLYLSVGHFVNSACTSP